jgi:hypothetical protein
MADILNNSVIPELEDQSRLLAKFNSPTPLEEADYNIQDEEVGGSVLTRGELQTKLKLMFAPPDQQFIRVHPDPAFHPVRALLRDGTKLRIVARAVFYSLEDHHRHSFLVLPCVTLAKKPFVWYIEIIRGDRRYESARDAAARCMTEWCQVFKKGWEFGVYPAKENAKLGEPDLSRYNSLQQFLQELFGDDPINDLKDAFIQRLQGSML